MVVRANAALTLVKRRELVVFISEGGTLKAAAAAFRVGPNTVRRWWRRYKDAGEAGLADRSSRPASSPRRTPEGVRERIVALRRERRDTRRIAREVGVSPSTVASLRDLDPPEPDDRCEHPFPGAMLHVDVKRLARFDAPGHRVTGDRSLGRTEGAGHDFLFVAVDDHSRLALVGVYPDERKESAADFLAKVRPHKSARSPRPEGARRQRTVLFERGRPGDLRTLRMRPQDHPPLPTPYQRQGRTVHPDPPRANGPTPGAADPSDCRWQPRSLRPQTLLRRVRRFGPRSHSRVRS